MLPDVAGKDVVELGCGTAYFGAWLARRGARVVGVDLTPAQLETARRMEAEFALGMRVRGGERRGDRPARRLVRPRVLRVRRVDLVRSVKWIPEAARLLRPGGLLVFLRNSTLAVLCGTADGGPVETLQRPQRGLHRIEWTDAGTRSSSSSATATGSACCARTASSIEELHELYAPEYAIDHEYYHSNAEWSKKWPCEEIWRARLHRR